MTITLTPERAARFATAEAAEKDDFVLCKSPDGWSLHEPGSSDEDIATGDSPYLVSGPGAVPADTDYEAARRVLIERLTH